MDLNIASCVFWRKRKMSKFKFQIELFFERWGYFVCRHSKKSLLFMFLFIASIVSQLPTLTVDTSFEGMLHEDDPKRIEYNNFRDQFGQDRIIICTVQTKDVFQKQFLTKLKSFHDELEKGVPHLDEVNSLINARSTKGDGDTLIVEDLLKDWPSRERDLISLKKYVLNNHVYINDYITEDGRVAAIIIKPIAAVGITDDMDMLDDFQEDMPAAVPEEGTEKSAKRHYLSKADNKEVVDAVYRITEKYRSPDFKISLAGGPVSEEVYDSQTKIRGCSKFCVSKLKS
jgi:predicted RND superfamily exporter protein